MYVPEHRHARVCCADRNIKVKKTSIYYIHAIPEGHSQKAHIYLKILCAVTNTFVFNLESKLTRCFFVFKLKFIQEFIKYINSNTKSQTTQTWVSLICILLLLYIWIIFTLILSHHFLRLKFPKNLHFGRNFFPHHATFVPGASHSHSARSPEL